MLYGDPAFDYRNTRNIHYAGNFNPSREGVLPDHSFATRLAPKTMSFCRKSDPICQGRGWPPYGDMQDHHYATPHHQCAGARWISSQLKGFGLPCAKKASTARSEIRTSGKSGNRG